MEIGKVQSMAFNTSFKGLEKKGNPDYAHIAINGGGGRIGRNSLWQYALAKHAPLEVNNSWDTLADIYGKQNLLVVNLGSAGLKGKETINDTDPKHLEAQLKNDSILGKLPDAIKVSVTRENNGTFLNLSSKRGGNEKIQLIATRDDVPFAKYGAEIVVETSGSKKTVDDAAAFNKAAGTKYTVVSAPVKGALTVVAGVNNERIDEIDRPENKNVISAASCTTTCISPLIKLIDEKFGVESGIIETTHSVTATQFTADKTKKVADSKNRNSGDSMIPTTTGAAKAVGLVLPELNGSLDGAATRVPVKNGSMAILVLNLKQETDLETVKKVLKDAEKDPRYKNLIVEAPLGSASCDVLHAPESAMYVPEQLKLVKGKMLMIKAYYDNEFGYTRSLGTLTSKLAEKVIADKTDPIDAADPMFIEQMRARSGEDLL